MANTNLLKGEVIENPEGQELPIEELLTGFLRALLEEQRPRSAPEKTVAPSSHETEAV